MSSRTRQRLAAALGLVLSAAGLQLVTTPVASANPAGTGLVINEVYGGGGNANAVYTHDFIELYNPSPNPISVDGLSLQYRAASPASGTPGSSNVFALPAKTVQPGDFFLVQAAAGTSVTDKPLPVTPDAQTTGTNLNLSGTGGQIYLATGTAPVDAGTGTISNPAVIDFVGWGTSTTSYEGVPVPPAVRNAAPATTNATSIARKTTGLDTDSNAADFEVLTTPTPTASAPGPVEPVAATAPSAQTGYAGTPIAPLTLTATGGVAPYRWEADGLPAGLALSGNTITGRPTTPGTSTVELTVSDSATPTADTDEISFEFTIDAALAPDSIAAIQGTGPRSPFAPPTGNDPGQLKKTSGVVTARYASGGYNGMYIQTPGVNTEGASDAIFVYAGSANANIPADVEIGDSVEVTGRVAEFFTLTQIVPASAAHVEVLDEPLGTVEPLEVAYPATEEEREALEGMLLAPTSAFTVTNNYQTNQYAEIGLAASTEVDGELVEGPLKQPTDHVAPSDTAGLEAIVAENAARLVTLDDGQTTNFLQNQTTKGIPLPWMTAGRSPRVGDGATFESPVILDYRNNNWKLQPTTPVTGAGTDVVTFEDTRAQNLTPDDVGGDIKLATFNVLNYFNTTGEAYAAAGAQEDPPVDTHCTYYTDRAGARIGNNQCGVRHPGETYTGSNPNDGRGPRGAATDASLARQQTKLVNAINAMDADIVALEEIESSIKLVGEDNRDDALAQLVRQLNADAGAGTWRYVRSPGSALTPAGVAEQDVIRSAFIYRPAVVDAVGQSDMLFGTSEFTNAREPLAQAFKAAGAPNSDAFGVIANHFKSKGDSGQEPATGDNANDPFVGAYNGDRIRQATRLAQYADDFAASRDLEALFLIGDFNSYAKERPIEVLDEAGFQVVESDNEGEETYSFSGLWGSVDHVLANDAAREMVTGSDIWEINANESVAYQYSRYNYNATILFDAENPFATSDHNPHVVGIEVPDFTPVERKEIQVLGTNDFHGRLLPDGGNAAGAARLATAVKELREENPHTVFAAAGDLVGASTFESFIQQDNPTIDALNSAGLEVSAAGNHEFDRGYDDFVHRIQDRAAWEYIAANVEVEDGMEELADTWTTTVDGVKIGFVGAVTEDLPALVNPAGIEGVTVTDVVDATNTAAAGLRAGADPADLVVLLVHEGSSSTSCSSATFTDPSTVWGNITQNTSADVDAIISGHTHLAYNCRFPVDEWVDEERAVTRRPVVSAGQYGTNLNQLVFSYDAASGELLDIEQEIVAAAGVGYAADPDVQQIVDDAVEVAEELGAEVLGRIGGPFNRAQYQASGTATENRGGESTLSNLVAEVQRAATQLPDAGIESDLAFMNPGGLRADMTGIGTGSPRDLNYRQAADVQPFANTLVNMELTGAQIKTVLEQQWQRTATGNVPSRPFQRLGVSDGFTYTYVTEPETVSLPPASPVQTFRGEVTGMWLDGEPIDLDETYSVTVNSFLANGGDNFWELAEGTRKRDTGQVDLEAMVDFMEQYESEPLPVDYRQRAVEVSFPADAPEVYETGGTVAFDVASWAMTATGDRQDAEISVTLDGEEIGTATLDNSRPSAPYDDAGTAAVSVELPGSARDEVTLVLVGETTGTEIPVEIRVASGERTVQVLATNDFHGRIPQTASNGEAGAAVLAGAVKQLRAENPDTVFAAAGDLIGASTFDSFVQRDKPTIDALNEAGLDVSAVGNHELDGGYDDLVGRVLGDYDAETNPYGGAEWEYIAANLKMRATGDEAVPATFLQEFGDVQIGFVGAVTEDLPSLVNPEGIAELEVLDIVESVNAEATTLKAEGADAVVMLVHEGAPGTSCAPQNTPGTTWGDIVTGVNADVDAIVSGHTHLAYDCRFPVAAWADRAVTERPVVSAGQYGMNLNQLEFTFDGDGELIRLEQALLPLMTAGVANYPADPATQQIVDAAVEAAGPIGNQVLGQIAAPFSRAKYSNGTENRGSSSTAGNMIAEVQRWATPERLGAQIAFMNPGGIRGDLTGTGTGAFPRDLTYRQAANVQSFANSLINMRLTGAQIRTALEQQWQRTAAGAVPTRAFLRLGVSEGFSYTYREIADPAVPGATKGVVTGMWLDGEPLDPAATYSVTVNSFLAPGGDNFRVFGEGTEKTDWGMTDLQSMVEYFDEFGSGGEAIEPDYAQRAVEVSFPASAPASYEPGATVAFDLAALAMTGSAADVADLQDAQVEIRLGEQVLGTAPVDNSVTAAPDNNTTVNDAGTARVEVTLPDDVAPGSHVLTVHGATTGTVVRVPVEVAEAARLDPRLTAAGVRSTYGRATTVRVRLDPAATGTVQVRAGSRVLGSAPVSGGVATVTVPARALRPGRTALTASYAGDGRFLAGSATLVARVDKAASRTRVAIRPGKVVAGRTRATVTVVVDAPAGVRATGRVRIVVAGQGAKTVAVRNGRATRRLAVYPRPGRKNVVVRYLGSDLLQKSNRKAVVTVRRR